MMRAPPRPLVLTIEGAAAPETIGLWIALWVEDVVFAAEYWGVVAARLALGAVASWRNRLLTTLSIGIPGAAVLLISMQTQCCSSTRFATLDLRALANGIELYRVRNAELPNRLEDLVPAFAKQLHLDPWGHNYVFYRGAGGYALVSAGPDGQLGTADDLVAIGASSIVVSGK